MLSSVLRMITLLKCNWFLGAVMALCWFCCPQVWAGAAVDAANRSIQLALSTEPPDLNSLTATDSVSFFVLLHTQEGLLTYGEGDALTGGVAESWSMDGNTARFTLRENARWCDGKPVTAQDFVFAWRTALDARTASRYAFILYPLKNAEKVHRGELPPDQLGVAAEDDRHLRIELEKPTAYFLSLTTFPTYFPLREDFYRAQQGRYGADAQNLLCNGAFSLSQWLHGASLTLKKNPLYWNARNISLEKINVPYITNEPNTLFNLFQSGDIAYAELTHDSVNAALQQRLYIQPFANGMLTYLEFNQLENNPLRNIHLRKAIAQVIDRHELVNKIIAAPGTRVAQSFFPQWLQGLANDAKNNGVVDLVAAHTELALAKKELQLQTIPSLNLLVYDSPAVVRQAEYLQRVLQQSLGLTVVIDRQIFKQKLAKLAAGQFDMALSAWGPDYNDAMTFADLLLSSNENNHGYYRNSAYDDLLARAAHLPDGAERNALFSAMQAIIRADVAVLPLTEPGIIYVQDKSLRKVQRRRFGGDPDFRYADILSVDSEAASVSGAAP
jgi:oligopeptide transport system substrate-binding protein